MSEHSEQAAVIDWRNLNCGRWPELDLLYSIPNGAPLGGGKLGAIRMHQLKSSGLRPGMPDLCLPVARHGFNACYIEMKMGNAKPQENQVETLDDLQKQGNFATVCRSAAEAIEALTWYLT